MGFGKKDIVKNISSKALITSKSSSILLDSFLSIIKENKKKKIKLSNFGTFYLHKSPRRVGRNPKTREEFEIKATEKLSFKVSNKIKSLLN
tara:strand:+ start:1521 stop:1793 length:273 start_codon:yes stop_codon:yes gene_type:complete